MKEYGIAARINEVVLVQQNDRPAQITLDQLVPVDPPAVIDWTAFHAALAVGTINIL